MNEGYQIIDHTGKAAETLTEHQVYERIRAQQLAIDTRLTDLRDGRTFLAYTHPAFSVAFRQAGTWIPSPETRQIAQAYEKGLAYEQKKKPARDAPAWQIIGAAIIFILVTTMFSAILQPPATPPVKVAPVAVAPTETPQDRATRLKKEADDEKFFAEKARKEQAEVEKWNAEQEHNASLNAQAAEQQEYLRAQSQIPESEPPPSFEIPADDNLPEGTGLGGGGMARYQASQYQRRPADGAPKDNHVSGYVKKDGTQVSGYNRRSRR